MFDWAVIPAFDPKCSPHGRALVRIETKRVAAAAAAAAVVVFCCF